MYQDLQGYLMHRYRLPLALLEMAENFDIKDHKPKIEGPALRLDGFDLDTPAGEWQQLFENQYRYLKHETVNANWKKTGHLVICEKCLRALPALFSFDNNVLKPGENFEDPHPICRMCQLIPTCYDLLSAAVESYVPITPQDAAENRKPNFEDGDPHKPVATGEVDPSTWLVPESTGPSPWSDVSMQLNPTSTYSPLIFSPICVMRQFPPRPTIPPKIPKSKALQKVLKLLDAHLPVNTVRGFDLKLSKKCSVASVLSGAICYHQNCEYKYTEACPLVPNCSDLDCPRTHLPPPCPCDWNKASPEHLATVPHATVRESLNEARVIAWKLHLLDLCGV